MIILLKQINYSLLKHKLHLKTVHRSKIVEQKLMILLLVKQILLIFKCLGAIIEYSDNYSDTLGYLWIFTKEEITGNANVTNNNDAPAFNYKAGLINNNESYGQKTE